MLASLAACSGITDNSSSSDSSTSGGGSGGEETDAAAGGAGGSVVNPTGGADGSGAGGDGAGGMGASTGGAPSEAVRTTPTENFEDESFAEVALGSVPCGVTSNNTLVCQDLTYEFSDEVVDVAVGDFITQSSTRCALLVTGKIECATALSAEFDPEAHYVLMDAGDMTFCAITDQGRLDCNRGFGPDGSFSMVSVGDMLSCAITTADELRCFDAGVQEEDGFAKVLAGTPSGSFVDVSVQPHMPRAACGLKTDGTLHCFSLSDFTELWSPEGSFSEIALALLSACALSLDGELSCWNFMDEELSQWELPPGPLHGLAGGSYTGYCALDSSQKLVCFQEG